MVIFRWFKKNIVFTIATVAALVTCFLVPPDKEYFSYFDWKTLACLFLTLAVICALRNIKFFTILSRRLVLFSGNLRSLFFMLNIITFIGSMIIANDMALITFLPLGYFALSVTNHHRYMAYLFILQNISANLGGMLTPFGNPQNLYLYSFYKIPTSTFTQIMLPPFLLAIAMIAVACMLVKREPLTILEEFPEQLHKKKTLLYCLLFAFSILIVFRVIPFWLGLVIVPLVLLFVDKEALKMVDYPLLGTFFFFFVFAGNLSRMNEVHQFLSQLLQKDTLLVSSLSCQVISNVPSAILLSRFTGDYQSLLLGVNIGGNGTLIASLARLITYGEFRKLYPAHGKQYFWLFTLINVIVLVVMLLVSKFFFVA